MKEVTLGRVEIGNSFWFGDVKFKVHSAATTLYAGSPEEFVGCEIYGKQRYLQISACACVLIDHDNYKLFDRLTQDNDVVL